jgi:ABC-type sulfate/molybdate transport systems ATPase subunit
VGALLTLRGVRHRRDAREVLAIDGLAIAPGERLGVLGPNGAGKTTLLRLLAGLEPPTAGEIRLAGAHDQVGRRRRVAYAAQRPTLLTMSVQRNVELPLRFRGVPARDRRRAARAALGRVGAVHLADRPARALSTGEAQRVSLARALVTEPDVLLLDEPAAALDATAGARFLADLDLALSAAPRTVVHVSHRPGDLLGRSDRVLALLDGHVAQIAAPRDLLARPSTATVARLVGYDNVLEAERTADGAIHLGGRPVGLLSSAGPAGPVRLAVWASGIRIAAPDEPAIEGIVTDARLAPGRWEIAVDIGQPLVAHAHLGEPPPAPGTRTRVLLEPSLSAVIADSDRYGSRMTMRAAQPDQHAERL